MDLKKKTINGLTWSAISLAGKQGSQFFITIILARLLSPSDFGLIGMANVFMGFANIFAELGVSSALIQKQDLDEKHLSSAFWLNIIAGFGLTIVFILCSSFIASFYKKTELRPILLVMSFNFVLSSLTIVQQALLQKEMHFRSLAIRDILSAIFAGIVGIFFALHGFGVWSLVYQLLTFTFINNVLLWSLSHWRPKFFFSVPAIKDIYRFSFNMSVSQFVNYFARNVDGLLIGRYLGAEPLGYYSLAYRLMRMPIDSVSHIIGKVIFPVFSKLQHNKEKISSVLYKSVKGISLITFPLMSAVFLLAPQLITLFFGAKWQVSIKLIQVLCFAGIFQSIGGPIVGNVRIALGETKLHLKVTILHAIFSSIAIFMGLRWGVMGVTILFTFFTFLWYFYTNAATLPLIKMPLRTMLSAFLVPIFVASVTSLFFIISKFFVTINSIAGLVLIGLLGSLTYFVALLIFGQLKITFGRKIKIKYNYE